MSKQDENPELSDEIERYLSTPAADRLRACRDDHTPVPVDVPITSLEAWHHADRVGKRTTDLLATIAKDAGDGMQVGDAVRTLAKHVRFWKRIVIAVLIPVGGALVALALKIYSKGYDDGIAAAWKRGVDERLERLERYRWRRDEQPALLPAIKGSAQ